MNYSKKVEKLEIQQAFAKGFYSKNIYAEIANGIIWDEVLSKLSYIPVAYTREMLDYQRCYMRCFVDQLIDLSIIIYYDSQAVGIWPLSLKYNLDECEIVTNEGAVLKPLLIQNISKRLEKKIYEVCLQNLLKFPKMLKKLGYIGNLKEQFFAQNIFLANYQDEWHRRLMDYGSKINVTHELYVDLSLSQEKIKTNIRKSFKSLVNLGKQLWKIKIYDRISDREFSEFRELHYQVSGRVTRSLETWKLQKEAINRRAAFLILMRDQNDSLIGGGLFHISRDEGVYAVGVYDRNLFDKPIAHVLQMEAIGYMQKMGLRWYRLGTRFYEGDARRPTEKECSIAYFKEGFATHMFFNFMTECSLPVE